MHIFLSQILLCIIQAWHVHQQIFQYFEMYPKNCWNCNISGPKYCILAYLFIELKYYLFIEMEYTGLHKLTTLLPYYPGFSASASIMVFSTWWYLERFCSMTQQSNCYIMQLTEQRGRLSIDWCQNLVSNGTWWYPVVPHGS